jgi:hypothetical protein
VPTKTKKQKPITFRSVYPNLQVTVEPGRPQLLDINRNVIQTRTSGRHIQFEANRYETSDPEEIEFLKGHEYFDNPRGFWERGASPREPRPTTKDQLADIARASAKGDAEALEALLSGERQTHNRFEVVIAAEAAVEAVQEVAPKKTKKTAEVVAKSAEDNDDGDPGNAEG